MNNIKLELKGPEEFGTELEAYSPEEYSQKYSASVWLGLILCHGDSLTGRDMRSLNVEKFYLSDGYYRVLVFSAYCEGDPSEPGIRFPKERQYAYYVAGNVIKAVLSRSYVSYFAELNGRFVALLSFIQPDPDDVLSDIAASIAADVRYAVDYCREQYNVRVSCSESAFYSGAASIPAAYRQAQEEEAYNLFSSRPRHNEEPDGDAVRGGCMRDLIQIRELAGQLFAEASDMRAASVAGAGEAAARLADYIMSASPYSVTAVLRRVEYMLYVLLELASGVTGAKPDDEMRSRRLEMIGDLKSEDDLRAYVAETADELARLFESGRRTDSVANADRAKSYILENYSDSGLTVAVVAETLGINVNTLSAQFRRLCGMSIAEFIHRTRLDCAVELLRDSGHSLGEICEQSGFGSINTMYRSFKKYLHTSPAGFRPHTPR